jgi:hypothetical protein
MRKGSQEIGGRASAKVTGIAFALTYLWASVSGAGAGMALQRASIAAALTMVLAALLLQPVVDVVLDALARDKMRRQAELNKENDQ